MANKYLKLFVKFMLQLVSSNISIQNDEKNITNNFSFSIPSLDPATERKNKKIQKNKVYIVDDIERCKIPPQEIFGFFSDFIIDENAKVIFKCNEEELKKRIAKNSDDVLTEYDRQKEKTIGMEFQIIADKDAAINFFIDDYKLEKYRDFLLQNTKNVMDILSCNNLRIIQEALYYLRIIFNSIAEYKIVENTYNDIVVYFLVVFIAKSEGKLNNGKDSLKNNILKSIKDFNANANIYANVFPFEPKEPAKIPLYELFPDMIFNGDFSEERISKAYKAITNPSDDKTLYLSSMQANWKDFSDLEFKKHYDELKHQLKIGAFLCCSQLWNFSELFLNLIELKIIPDTQETLEQDICNYLNKYKQKIKPDILPDKIDEMLYYGEGYQSSMIRSKTLINSLCDFSLEKIKENEEREVKRIIGDKNSTSSDVIKIIEYNYNPDFPNCTFSTFDFVSADEFFKKITSFPHSEQKNIFYAFKKVFNKLSNTHSQLDILNKIVYAINDIAELYDRDCSTENIEMQPSKYLKSQLAIKYKKFYEEITKI